MRCWGGAYAGIGIKARTVLAKWDEFQNKFTACSPCQHFCGQGGRETGSSFPYLMRSYGCQGP